MAAERIPIKNMELRKEKIEGKKQLVIQLTKLVEDLRAHVEQNADAKGFKEFKVETNNDILGATVDKALAKNGNYKIEVLQTAQKSSAMSSGFKDPDKSSVGVGHISYRLPNGQSRSIYISSGNSSLNGIANLINSNPQVGLSASVVNDGSGSKTPWRLLLARSETGDNQKAEFPYFYFIDGDDDFYLEHERPARNGRIKVDGFEIEVPDNIVKNIIPGVTLDLKKAKPGEEVNLGIIDDSTKVIEKVDFLVQKINSVFDFIHEQNRIDANTDTSRTLGGEIVLQSLESRLRGVIFQDVMTDKGPRRLANLGINFTKEGRLSLDAKQFELITKNDYPMVSQIMIGSVDPNNGKRTSGLIDNLRIAINNSLRTPDGLLPSRKKTLQTGINEIDRRIAQREKQIEQKEKMIKDKFARLEGTMSRLKGQGAGLASLGGGGNPIQQMG